MNEADSKPGCTCAKHRRVTHWLNCAEFDALVKAGVIDETGLLLRPELLLSECRETTPTKPLENSDGRRL